MSSTLTKQLNVPWIELAKPLSVQLAAQGSQMKVNYGMKVMFAYQRINTEQYFNIMNLQNYDLILGTLLLFQYQVLVRLNGLWIIFGSKSLLPITGEQLQVLESRAANILNDQIDEF